MYGIVEINGHQYNVRPGMLLDVEKLEAQAGSSVELDKVLFVGGSEFLVGKPTVSGAKITAKVIKHDKGKKILVLKRKVGKWQRKNGHRQHYTSLLITEVHNGKGQSESIDKESKLAKKYLA